MKIAIQILFTESWHPLSQIVLPNADEYCRAHSYQPHFVVYEEPYPSDFGFTKLTEARDLFENGVDVVVSMDLDTMITNHLIPIESFLERDKGAYFTFDVNGLNCGVFILVNSDWTKDFIDRTLERKGRPNIHCEQDAIADYLKEFPTSGKVKMCNHPSFNSYLYEEYKEYGKPSHEDGQWQLGDFVLHIPGVSMERRMRLLSKVQIIK